jgi:hypothetical protein
MEAHPNADLHAVRPRLRGKTALGVDRRPYATVCGREHREEAVALGLLLVPADAPDRCTKDLPVPGEQRRPGLDRERLGELGRTLDVREQERDRPDGLCGRRGRC